ncbi:cytochrome c biogenesis CcdA family protein [Candidatus Magnetaquicoccus inordinatus]|uniref:cytochrome c biogenesis CcdA family protein n=1 Tax=Candidatus Magnetaquicoccus inordinatus TaxID=2496818 RepID=UPI00102C4B7E|nr:cytochrome c biogenesis protein CcdA [Candidatus Magnetaquicoccus inordinatus]
MENVTVATALLAGLLSFVSPCVLPLVPAYISFMSGVSVAGMQSGTERGAQPWRIALFSLFFVSGFATVFILLGASATLLSRWLLQYMQILAQIGGGLIILFGLHYMGILRVAVLNQEARFNLQRKPPGLWGAYLIGLAFAFGWTPCVGPILAGILAIAGSQESVQQGIVLLAVYSAGLGIPFVLAGLAINHFFLFFSRIRNHLQRIEQVSGGLLVLVGLLIMMGGFNQISVWLMQWFPGLAKIG